MCSDRPSRCGFPPFARRRRALLPALAAASALCAAPGRANISIVPTFDASITGRPDAQDIEDGINAALAELESYILTPTTVAITFQSVTDGLGTSSTSYGGATFADYVAHLQSRQALSPFDLQAQATLPPDASGIANGSGNVSLTLPLLRAVGFTADPDPGAPDSTVSLNTPLCNDTRSGPQDPDKYDLQQVTMHEVCEVLGAGGAGTGLPDTTADAGSLDFYRYNAPGVRSYTTDSNEKAYFSIDNGATNLSYFSQVGEEDFADWNGSQDPGPQVQDAESTPGVQMDLTANELIALDIVGYDLTPAGVAIVTPPVNALAIAGGLRAVPMAELPRVDARPSETGASVDILDAVALARQAAGLSASGPRPAAASGRAPRTRILPGTVRQVIHRLFTAGPKAPAPRR